MENKTKKTRGQHRYLKKVQKKPVGAAQRGSRSCKLIETETLILIWQ